MISDYDYDAATLRTLAESPDWETRREVLWHPTCPQDVKRKLWKDPDVRVQDAALTQRSAAARHEQEPEILEQLAEDPSLFIRSRVTLNPATPHYILRGMYERGDHDDIMMHLSRRLEDLDALIHLSGHDNRHVRQAATRNLHIPFGVWVQNQHFRMIP